MSVIETWLYDTNATTRESLFNQQDGKSWSNEGGWYSYHSLIPDVWQKHLPHYLLSLLSQYFCLNAFYGRNFRSLRDVEILQRAWFPLILLDQIFFFSFTWWNSDLFDSYTTMCTWYHKKSWWSLAESKNNSTLKCSVTAVDTLKAAAEYFDSYIQSEEEARAHKCFIQQLCIKCCLCTFVQTEIWRGFTAARFRKGWCAAEHDRGLRGMLAGSTSRLLWLSSWFIQSMWW